MRKRRAAIVLDLEAQGLVFRTFTTRQSTPFSLDDWDWNQRDVPHIRHVHGDFRAAPLVLGQDEAVAVYLQNLMGLRVPMTVVYYHLPDSPMDRVYNTSLGPLTVVIESSLRAVEAGTELTTTYSLGAMPWARWLLPVAERLMRRNAQTLVDEDVPLLARRAELRAWGHRFEDDGGGAGYLRSMRLAKEGVLPPPDRAPVQHRLTLAEAPGQTWLGRADDRGLRVIVDADRVTVYPRMCPHAGARLDACPVRDGALACPWHGRRIVPWLDAPLSGRCRERHASMTLTLEDGVLRVEAE